ncbi:MAG: putative glycoside hydrolase [Pseudomonadota bacterium]
MQFKIISVVLLLAWSLAASGGCGDGNGVEVDGADAADMAEDRDMTADDMAQDDVPAEEIGDVVEEEEPPPPPVSGFPKTNITIWGGASPAWYAEFDFAVTNDSNALAAKELNPDLIVSTLCDTNACWDCAGEDPCPAEWSVKTTDGTNVPLYGSCCLGDTTEYCGLHGGKTYREATVENIVALTGEERDGWTSGGFWTNLEWFTPPIDIDQDGDSDGDDHQYWKDGRLAFMQELRAAMPDKIIVLNAGKMTDVWGEGPAYVNGSFAEFFMVYSSWSIFMEASAAYAAGGLDPNMCVIDNSYHADPDPGRKSRNNFRNMRFGLAATLLFDGYYSYKDGISDEFADGINEHYFNRYYDEYDVPLGEPLGPYATIKDEVYCRFFEGGAMILNVSNSEHTVTEAELQAAAESLDLNWDTIAGTDGHYYRFSGQQNPEFNDGSLLSEVTLPSRHLDGDRRKGDGILLVRSPGQVVMAAVIIDTEEFVTSPGAVVAALSGFEQSCDYRDGFKTGGGSYCNDTTHPYKGHARAGAGAGATATLEVTLVNEGNYRVYEYHPGLDGYDIPHTVHHADGQETILVDQRSGADRWNLLGEYRFTPDQPAQVVISALEAQGGRVAADAIRFEWAGE